MKRLPHLVHFTLCLTTLWASSTTTKQTGPSHALTHPLGPSHRVCMPLQSHHSLCLKHHETNGPSTHSQYAWHSNLTTVCPLAWRGKQVWNENSPTPHLGELSHTEGMILEHHYTYKCVKKVTQVGNMHASYRPHKHCMHAHAHCRG
jgi:hypothetical protein